MNLLNLAGTALSNGLLATQIMFSVGYVGTCELANLFGPRDLGVCEARWSTVLALWCPSGLQRGGGAARAAAERRKGLFRS